MRELERGRGGQHHVRHFLPTFPPAETPGNRRRDRRMRVDQVPVLPEHAPDRRADLRFVRVSRGEGLRELLPDACRYGINAFPEQSPHAGGREAGIPAGSEVQHPLQVAGHQDVHGRGNGPVERPVPVVNAGFEERGQHPVVVGCADQAPHGQAEHFREIPRKDVAEVPGGHRVIHGVPVPDGAGREQVRVGLDVVGDLGHKPPDVDGIRGAEGHRESLRDALLHDPVEHPLDGRLRVVKVPAHRAGPHIGPLLGGHLELLDGADAALRVEDADAGAGHVPEARHGRFPGVPGRRGQDDRLLPFRKRLLCADQELRERGQRHVLERVGRPVEQLEVIRVPGFPEGRHFLRVEPPVIGARHDAFHIREVVQEHREQLRRHPFEGQGHQRFHVLLPRECGRHIQPVVRRDAPEDRHT